MQPATRSFLGAIIAAGAVLAAAATNAETWTLDLKQRESKNPQAYGTDSYLYWATSGQRFFVQMAPPGSRIRFPENEQHSAAFKRTVTKEPKYESDRPFRGVVKLGSHEYAFALDAAPPKAKAKDEKPKEKGKEEAKKDAEKPVKDSAAKPDKKRDKKATPPKTAATAYNRLYFDFNHNGDLTDDKVVEAKTAQRGYAMSASQSYAQIQFPLVEVTIDAGGTPLRYAFFLSGYVMSSADFGYASLTLNTAVLRQGDITLEGKKHHVVLIDFNSNGRFDDETTIRPNVSGPNGQVYPEQGDMLLIDPPKRSVGYDSPYDVTQSAYRYYVSKLIHLDGRFYDLKISPAGDKLTLTPSSTPLGSVTNPNVRFAAVIYGDQGLLKISGSEGQPVAVPEGQWRLLSYTINATETPQPSKPAEQAKKGGKKTAKDGGATNELASALVALMGGGPTAVVRPRYTLVAAQATGGYKAVEVRQGKTVEMPFGPPYKPVVKAYPSMNQKGEKVAALQMSLVGSAGEQCTNLMVDSGRPSKPHFTITDPQGKVVEQGDFEYG
jgi:hypothetical protein